MRQGNFKQNIIHYEDLDADMIENYLVRLLQFLISITSTSMPYLLMHAYVSAALHMAVINILSVSELKGQRISTRLLSQLY
jgi:hypothetical protein